MFRLVRATRCELSLVNRCYGENRLGILIMVSSSFPEVILGRAMFIVGPSGEKVPLGLEQSLHAWLAIDGDGYFDLSLRLDESVMPGGNWLAWPVEALAANQFVPSEVASFIHTAQAANYEQKTAILRPLCPENGRYWIRARVSTRTTSRRGRRGLGPRKG